MMPELFKTIVVDPPWLERGGGRITRGAQRHYELMDKSAIIRTITQWEHWNNIGVDAHLYLWVTNNHLPDGLEVMSALGFKYVTNVCWAKDRHGLGQYFRGQHEICLFGTRGKGYNIRTSDKSISTVINARRTQHSRKPDAFYDMVERRSSGPHLDLFGRRDRPGWVVWGDEAPEITEEINHTTLTDEAYVIDNNDIHGAPI